VFCACWKTPPYHNGGNNANYHSKVWGYKPIYATEQNAKEILFTAKPQPVIFAGNIYAYQKYIFQMETGYGIHVVDNSNPASAERIGFIKVKGCAQISIKGDKLYTNSFDDLVVIDFSDLNNVHEFSRAAGVFSEYRYGSPISLPPGTGYYECPEDGKFVVDWQQDSVYQQCYH